MTRPYFAEFAQGNDEAACHVIDFYGGAGTFDSMPTRVREYVIKTTAVNVRDWSSGTPFVVAMPSRRRGCPEGDEARDKPGGGGRDAA